MTDPYAETVEFRDRALEQLEKMREDLGRWTGPDGSSNAPESYHAAVDALAATVYCMNHHLREWQQALDEMALLAGDTPTP